jgi:MoaA/NifB/PqqE/SkfB family radical SAM enzyme
MPTAIDHRTLYRLPWNLADNPIAWLEPTQACNLACDGCYRANVLEHKSMAEVEADLDVFAKLRTFDGVSIAGGDPLVHPELPAIVRRVTARGHKAIVNTNGLALTRELLGELKTAGLVGITFHVDSKQGRPGWRGKDEKGMCDLRSEYAELVASVGGIAVAFNSTVYEDTLEEVPDLVAWAERNVDLVQTMVFITLRAAALEGFDYFQCGKKVDVSPLAYASDKARRTDISSREVVDVIRTRFPDFEPCAYLNGTEAPDSFKWLVALRAGSGGQIDGYLGARFMEVAQASYHLLTGRYMSYAAPDVLAMGRMIFSTSWWDAGVRSAARAYARRIAQHPLDLLKRERLQSIVVIQPIDVLPDGRQNMCDGCPDMTVHDGRLVWSCRLEEPRQYGGFLTSAPSERS